MNTSIPFTTLQDLFDQIVTRQAAQGELSMSKGHEKCRYRGVSDIDGTVTACAVGCIIPDDLYDESLEGYGVKNLFHGREWLFKGWSDEALDLASALQHVHDCTPVSAWPNQWRSLADRFSLDASKVPSFVIPKRERVAR